jgi:hypothetical protein
MITIQFYITHNANIQFIATLLRIIKNLYICYVNLQKSIKQNRKNKLQTNKIKIHLLMT